MKLLFVVCIFFSSIASARSWNGVVYRAVDQVELSQQQLDNALLQTHVLVIGEKHYTKEVQLKEADLVERFAIARNQIGAQGFTLAWEFLAASEKTKTDDLYNKFLLGEISSLDFVRGTQSGNGDEYAPVFDALKKVNGTVIGINLTRAEKSPVTKGGIVAADPKLVPPNFELGSNHYYERFEAVMSAHVPPNKMQNYYEAQCLTDDVMAYETLKSVNNQNSVAIIAGSFHTDYYDGTVARLTARSPGLDVVTIRIIDAADYQEKDLLNELFDAKYGPIADYIIYVNEPTP